MILYQVFVQGQRYMLLMYKCGLANYKLTVGKGINQDPFTSKTFFPSDGDHKRFVPCRKTFFPVVIIKNKSKQDSLFKCAVIISHP